MGRARHYATNAERQRAYRVKKAATRRALPDPVLIGDCLLYCGDAARLVPLVEADALVTDPPYGLDLGVANNPTQDRLHLHKAGYASYADTYEHFCRTIVPILNQALDRVRCGAVFTGPHKHEQRKPDVEGGIHHPSAIGRTAWGSKNYLPVLFYGTPPAPGQHRKTVIYSTAQAEPSTHPCPKPLAWMVWLVELASRPGETVLDPFMGSGTTGVACLELGRKFIGIEQDPTYFALACARIEAAQRQGQLFVPAAKMTQGQLFAS
jgi:site-specific DNA-methyltransferase (adenine-specific)/modification methylase